LPTRKTARKGADPRKLKKPKITHIAKTGKKGIPYRAILILILIMKMVVVNLIFVPNEKKPLTTTFQKTALFSP
jgi:hypothetical protein